MTSATIVWRASTAQEGVGDLQQIVQSFVLMEPVSYLQAQVQLMMQQRDAAQQAARTAAEKQSSASGAQQVTHGIVPENDLLAARWYMLLLSGSMHLAWPGLFQRQSTLAKHLMHYWQQFV